MTESLRLASWSYRTHHMVSYRALMTASEASQTRNATSDRGETQDVFGCSLQLEQSRTSEVRNSGGLYQLVPVRSGPLLSCGAMTDSLTLATLICS